MNQMKPITDGWDDTDGGADRLIHGQLIKCVDGRWSYAKQGIPIDPAAQFIAANTLTTLVRWKGGQPTETMVKEPGVQLPFVDDLNAGIPEEQWEPGIDGEPRPPWQEQRLVYLIDIKSYAKVTFTTSTVGGTIAIRDLRDAIEMRRRLYSGGDVPIIELAGAPFKTRRGGKIRPAFRIVGWIGPTAQVQVETTPPQARIEAKPAAAPAINVKKSVAADLDDDIPY